MSPLPVCMQTGREWVGCVHAEGTGMGRQAFIADTRSARVCVCVCVCVCGLAESGPG